MCNVCHTFAINYAPIKWLMVDNKCMERERRGQLNTALLPRMLVVVHRRRRAGKIVTINTFS